MSLKARIEAVIYAAEEPVTLAQLASLFREEAAAERAARLAAEAPVPSEPTAQESADAEVATPDTIGETQPVPEATADEPAAAGAAEVASPTGAEKAEPEAQPQPVDVSVEDEKKAQRQRDREIRDELRRIVDELIADYASADRGLEIREVAGGYRMATRAEYHDAVRAFIKTLKPPMKLSLQALETLAVIAYKQPITAPEIGDVRGVDSSGVLGSLIARKLITTAGRKQVIGRPILYKTTREFLLRFGLKDLNELPSIEEFEKMASELAETEEESGAASEPSAPDQEESLAAQEEVVAAEEAAESPASAVSEEAEPPAPSGGQEVPEESQP